MTANLRCPSYENKCFREKDLGRVHSPLDKLAQLATNKPHTCENDDFNLSSDTSINDIQTLLKRARRKYFGTGLALALVNTSKQNENSVLTKSYWNTFHCVSKLNVMSDGKITGNYCKNRWCMVCNSIRTARMINQYQPIIDSWENKYLVTLTVPNCVSFDLENTIKGMFGTFNQIRKRIQKRNQRKKCGKLVGIRKLECTYNADRDDYHPHFHLIVLGEDMASEIVDIWLDKYRHANRKAQDIRVADSNSSKELFKYFTKVISKSGNGGNQIYADAMDVVFNAVRGRRTFQPFGFKSSVLEAENSPKRENYAVGVREWIQILGDWVDKDTGECLTGYVPSDGMKDLVENKIVVRKGYDGTEGVFKRWNRK